MVRVFSQYTVHNNKQIEKSWLWELEQWNPHAKGIRISAPVNFCTIFTDHVVPPRSSRSQLLRETRRQILWGPWSSWGRVTNFKIGTEVFPGEGGVAAPWTWERGAGYRNKRSSTYLEGAVCHIVCQERGLGDRRVGKEDHTPHFSQPMEGLGGLHGKCRVEKSSMQSPATWPHHHSCPISQGASPPVRPLYSRVDSGFFCFVFVRVLGTSCLLSRDWSFPQYYSWSPVYKNQCP